MADLFLTLIDVLMVLALLGLCLLSVNLIWIYSLFLRHRRAGLVAESRILAASAPASDDLPHVLVQIPTFNERHVVRRAVEAAAALDWPVDRLHIQLLDDSIDDTTEIGRQAVEAVRTRGVDAVLLHRTDRRGFKAGALQAGLEQCRADYVAILDADFLPPPDFLRRCVPAMVRDDGVGFVQARWEHMNADQNLLTRAQALMLDAHFAVEQRARCWAGLPVPFNGTCGVWRRRAIDDAGGWQIDTLTEDLDLSYRAHLRGWRGLFLGRVGVPGELPDTVPAWRTQQFRWNKGFAQVARKLLPTLWRTRMPWHHRVLVTFHLSQCGFYPLAAVALFCGLIQLFADLGPSPVTVGLGFAAAVLGLGSSLSMILTGQRLLRRSLLPWFAAGFLAVVALNSGLALSNGRGVVEGVAGRVSPFVRTPKKGDAAKSGYRAGGPTGLPELGYGLFGVTALLFKTAWFSPFLLVSVAGYLTIGTFLAQNRLAAGPPALLRRLIQARRRRIAGPRSDRRTGDLPG